MSIEFGINNVFSAVDRITPIVNRMSGSVSKFGDVANSSFNKASSSSSRFHDIVKGNLVSGAIQNITSGLSNFLTETKKVAAEAESLKVSMKSVFGESAASEMKFVEQTANELGLSIAAIAPAYQSISASAKGTTMQGEQVRQVFLGVSEAATALNLDGEKTGGALTALTQIISKGKVQAEELRGQLGERIPGAFQIAARAMDMSTAELDKFMSTGGLTADVFIPKFAAQLRKEFGGAANDAANSFAAMEARWGNSVRAVQVGIGSVMLPAITRFRGAMGPAFESLAKFIDKNKELINEKVSGAMTKLSNVISGINWDAVFTFSFNLIIIMSKIADTAIVVGSKIVNAFQPIVDIVWELVSAFIPANQTIDDNNTALDSVLKTIEMLSPVIAGGVVAWAAFKTAIAVTAAIQYAALLPSMAAASIALIAQKADIIITTTAFYALGASMYVVTAAQWLLNAAMSANPIGLIIIAIAALIAVIVLIYKNWDTIGPKFWAVANSIGDAIMQIWNWFSGLLDNPFFAVISTIFLPFITVPALIFKHWEPIMEFFTNLGGIIGGVASSIGNAASSVAESIGLGGDSESATASGIGTRGSASPAESRQRRQQMDIRFDGNININGAPAGSTASGKVLGAPSLSRVNMGVNP